MKPQEIFVKHVELAARFPNISSYLQLASTELDMWTYFCMDVWIFLITLVIFIIFTTSYLCNRIYRALFSSRKIKIS
jgi:hypothetical protein